MKKTKLAITLLLFLRLISFEVRAEHTDLSLDAKWQIAEGRMDVAPTIFEHLVPVPGLVSLATPPFNPPPGPKVDSALRRAKPQKDPARDAFWYRRTFQIKAELPPVAVLKVRKAMFGSQVFLNGQLLGEHLPSFTPGYFNARPALKTGENVIVIRIGADRDSVSALVPDGMDFEKQRYIPGIFDSVDLILSGTPHFIQLQAAPKITNQTVRVQAVICNDGESVSRSVSFVVREAKSKRIVGRLTTEPLTFGKGAETTVDVCVVIKNCRLWSPEDPFLYQLEADSGADNYQTRFGMREFKFTPAHDGQPGRAWLNGKPYFMRGSNFTLYRFFEDDQCRDLPWKADWVRLLHQRVKEMHWNSVRYTIGPPPEAWYDIADELGILIQDEFPFWGGWYGTQTTSAEELAKEYTEMMRDHWNHPCVVIWDAQNETVCEQTGAAIEMVRLLDLSNRPWDNGWSVQTNANDCYEYHNYHYYNPKNTLSKVIAKKSELPEFPYQSLKDQLAKKGLPANLGNKAVILNEYGWVWLNRDGTPTSLTSELFANLAGSNAPPSILFPLAAKLVAADTEYWRCRREMAGVMEFCSLSYSRPDGQTSDHWSNVEKLIWEPEFLRYVRPAFAPVGLMVDFCAESAVAGQPVAIPVIVINDLETPWNGTVTLRLLKSTKVLLESKQSFALESYGKQIKSFAFSWPAQLGNCQIEAKLKGVDGEPVHSVRYVELLAGPDPSEQ